MNTIGNIIVGMWFIPVALFILVPLTLFAGKLLFTAIKRLVTMSDDISEPHIVGSKAEA